MLIQIVLYNLLINYIINQIKQKFFIGSNNFLFLMREKYIIIPPGGARCFRKTTIRSC